MTILGKVIGGPSPASIALKGTELILDADADTTITADTDDRIDIKIAGADDFKFTANNFNVLSGSTLTIDSGATITNSGTANNFGTDPESAYAGVLQSNANFIDQVIFGPAVDGRSWNGLWNKASLFSSLMLATLEDEGSNAEINIWDLTEQSSGAISTTPLATIDLSNVEAASSIAACMGYLIIGNSSTDAVGFAIVDPHSGAWAERTQGWPKTLSTTTTPALTNNDVDAVAAGFSDQPAFDPRTGGPAPTFGIGYGTGDDIASLYKDDGNVWDRSGTVGNVGVGFINGQFVYANNDAQDGLLVTTMKISVINADDWDAKRLIRDDGAPFGLVADNGLSVVRDSLASASSSGLNSMLYTDYFLGSAGINAITNRTYTTGYMVGDIRGAWLANSKTVDRSYKANTLTENGTVTEGAVESSAELNGYSGLSTTNYLSRASDADWDVIGTGGFTLMGWVKTTSSSGDKGLVGFGNADGSDEAVVYIGSGVLKFVVDGDAGTIGALDGIAVPTNVWHHFACVHISSTERYIYQDGVQVASSTTDTGSISDSGNMPLTIGCHPDGPSMGATTETLSLIRLSAHSGLERGPTATQIRQMYDAEKGMFVASAECLLQSSSTDAVIDVDIDPLSEKVIVTQTDAITIFDGLVVDSKPTVNSGASEKGKLWGALRAEQNSANAYVTAPANDQRQVNEMVRGLANEMPAGVDLSKAKGWVIYDQNANLIHRSYNVKSISDDFTGGFTVNWAVPFKSIRVNDAAAYVAVCSNNENRYNEGFGTYNERLIKVNTRNDAGGYTDATANCVIAFGELENE
jgi:hypothetical protein